MNEIIEKYYQEEIESGSAHLLRGGIDDNWDRIMKLFDKKADVEVQNSVFCMIGDIASESAKNGFDTGFRAALRFMMSL